MKVKKLIKKLKKIEKEQPGLIVKVYDGSYAPEWTPANEPEIMVSNWGSDKGKPYVQLDADWSA